MAALGEKKKTRRKRPLDGRKRTWKKNEIQSKIGGTQGPLREVRIGQEKA